jgi:ankyrin repeat protein
MSITLEQDKIHELQKKYHYLTNYESDDPEDPIDLLTYIDSNGDNLLHIAAQLGDLCTVAVLVGAGMPVDQAGDMGCTALHYAYQAKHMEMIKFLLNSGASKNIQNNFGKLPDE